MAVDQGFYQDKPYFLRISSQFEDDKTAFISQDMHYLILNPPDFVV